MQNYLLYLSYNGKNYCGYQRQKNANTVGEELFKALKCVFGEFFSFSGCSRTDSGVHAICYNANFKAEKVLQRDCVVLALNKILPKDISVFKCDYVNDDFHARYSVKSKEYIYKIYINKIRNPFYNDFMFFYPKPINIKLMNSAAKYFIGTHDFTAFMVSGSNIKDCVRTINRAEFIQNGDIITFYISGDGFLYKMVRLIVGTLLYVSEGKIKKSELPKIIESREQVKGMVVPANGLYLNKVNYD